MFTRLAGAAALTTVLSVGVGAQDAGTVIANAAKALGADAVTSITYSGSAANGNFGQSKTIAGPLNMVAVSNYTRAIDFAQPASRATGQTAPAQPGGMPGNFNQLITPAQAAWTQQLEIWSTPWGFLKGAAANNAAVRSQRVGARTLTVVTWSPAAKAPSGQAYIVAGYLNDQNEVERVETRVEHAVVGDLTVETSYAAYQPFGAVKVPTRITQKRNGMTTFDATITAATANPPNITALLTPPPAPARQGGPAPAAAAPGGRAGGPPAPPAVETQKLAEGVYRITGGYVALAVDMGDHIVVLEGGQSEARGLAVIAAARQAIPNKPIRYVVNTHPHFDHASGLAPFAAEGITILTHENNEAFLERALSAPRTLVGDALAKANRKPEIDGVGDRRVLRGGGQTIELHHVRGLEHSDGMLIAFLPAHRILLTADFNIPAAGQPLGPQFATLAQNVDRLKLDYETFIAVHAPNPDRPLTRTDIQALMRGTN